MTTSSATSPDSFFAALKQSTKNPAKKPCFLLGNGISRYMNPAPSWTELLARLMNQVGLASEDNVKCLEKLDEGKSEMNAPEFYTTFLLAKGERMSRDHLKTQLKSVLGSQRKCEMLNYIQNQKLQVLTINFDFGIDQALGVMPSGARNPFSTTAGRTDSKRYPFYQYVAKTKKTGMALEGTGKEAEKGKKSVTDECAVWHIHGNVYNAKTILLGFEDYVQAIVYVREKLLKSATDPAKYAQIGEKDCVANNTWLKLFFMHPLVIAGCGLASEELFLRWLLLRRCRYYLGIEQPPVYYLVTLPKEGREQEYAHKKAYFQAMGIQFVEFADYAALYDAPGWKDLIR